MDIICAWGVTKPNGKLWFKYTAATEKKAKRRLINNWNEYHDWDDLYKQGYRVVPVSIAMGLDE